MDQIDDHRRLGIAGIDALLQQRDILVHVGAEALQPADPVLVIGFGLEADQVGGVVIDLHAVTLRHRKQVLLVCFLFQPAAQGPLEQCVIRPVGFRQAGRIDRCKALQEFLRLCFTAGKTFRTEIVPAIVVARIADIGSRIRVFAQVAFPVVVEQLVQLGAGGG